MDINSIEEARERIAPYVKRTPLEKSEAISRPLGTNVYIKYELFQKTGAFKARGAFNKMLTMSDVEKSRGVVAVSGGPYSGEYIAYSLPRDAIGK